MPVIALAVLALFADADLTRQRLVVLEFQGAGTAHELEYLTEVVRGAARTLPRDSWFVMSRENLLAVLPPDTDLSTCEGECEVETARNVGAHYVVSGEVVLFGGEFRASLKLHEAKSGELVGAVQAAGGDLKALEPSLSDASGRLLEALGRGSNATQPARLRVTLRPEGTVYVGLTPMGDTTLPPGTHHLLGYAPGFEVWRSRVVPAPGGDFTRLVPLRRARAEPASATPKWALTPCSCCAVGHGTAEPANNFETRAADN